MKIYKCEACDEEFTTPQEIDEDNQMYHLRDQTIHKEEIAFDVPIICGPIEEVEEI